MLVAVHDETDALFAHLLVTVARRRGHTARQVAHLDHIRSAFPSEPEAVIVGAARLDGALLDDVARLRARQPESFILLVAEDASAGATISALERGASEVLRKPVLPRELVIRIERGRSTVEGSGHAGVARVADLAVDLDRVHASKAGVELSLTRAEFRLLYCLVQHYGRIAPTERLMTFGGDEEMAASSLKTHISHLRQKLREAGGVPMVISARQLLGYVLEEAKPASASRRSQDAVAREA